ncbi:hypothetical protein MMC11_007449 [Xylographa trunciseda]|nr:hypothetical protein [Xylographa trunciseda]
MLENLVLFGWIGDRSPSRRTPFILGLVSLGTSTLCFALGSTIPVLLIARLLQGLSSAIVFTIGNALVLDVVGLDGIGKASGYTSMSITMGILSGPVAGGFIYDHAGYFAVFIPAFVLIVIDIVLRFMIIIEKRVPEVPTSVDSSKLTTPPTEVIDDSDTTHEIGRTQADKSGQSTSVDSHESSCNGEEEPLLPKARARSGGPKILILLSSARFLVAIVCLAMVNSFTTGFDGVLAVYVHDTFDFNATNSACLFLILALPALLSPISGAFTDVFGTKLPAIGGLLLLTTTLFLLRLIQRGIASPFVKLGVMMLCTGISVTLLNPAFIKESAAAVREIELESPGIFGPYGAKAQSYGLLSCAFAGGSMVGPLYAGFIRGRFGWSMMSLVMGILSSILLILTVLITGGHGTLDTRTESGSRENV